MKEIKLKLNTREGQDSFKTQKMVGKLDSIIVSVDEINDFQKVELLVESELGYLILQRKSLEGVNYLVPRIRTTTPIEDLRDYPSHEKFSLNEKVIVTVLGPKDIEVNIVFRIN